MRFSRQVKWKRNRDGKEGETEREGREGGKRYREREKWGRWENEQRRYARNK